MSADASAGPLPPGGLNELAARLSQPEFGHPLQATDDFCACCQNPPPPQRRLILPARISQPLPHAARLADLFPL